MKISIKATDFVLTPEVSDYIESRMAAIEKLVKARSADAEVRFVIEVGRSVGRAKSGVVWFAEANIVSSDAGSLRAVSHAESVAAAVDMAKDELQAQLNKRKRIGRTLLRRGGAIIKRQLRRF